MAIPFPVSSKNTEQSLSNTQVDSRFSYMLTSKLDTFQISTFALTHMEILQHKTEITFPCEELPRVFSRK